MKPKVIVIYGPIGVGKLTVARKLSEKIKFKVSHNHLFNDLVQSLFKRGSLEYAQTLEKLRFDLYEKAVVTGENFIMTHAYSHNFVSKTGQTDEDYLKNLGLYLTQAGAKVYFVHLKADDDILLERVSHKSRKEFKKLTDINIMRKYVDTKDFKTTPKLDNQIIIDTSKLTVGDTVNKILEFINIK